MKALGFRRVVLGFLMYNLGSILVDNWVSG
jgi:hypothetical protein